MFKTANRRGTRVPARIIACLGPGTLMAELLGPGTAFRCVPSYFNPCVYEAGDRNQSEEWIVEDGVDRTIVRGKRHDGNVVVLALEDGDGTVDGHHQSQRLVVDVRRRRSVDSESADQRHVVERLQTRLGAQVVDTHVLRAVSPPRTSEE